MTHTLFSRLMKDRAGNFGIMTAAMLPVLLGVAGMAIDFTHVMEEKNKLQGLADGAALAAASAMADKGTMTEAEADTYATSFLFAQAGADCEASGKSAEECEKELAERQANTTVNATTSASSGNSASYEVRMKTSYDIPLSGLTALIGFKTMRISVESVATSGRQGNALSMYLALDESGSMADDTTTVNPAAPTKTVTESVNGPYKCPWFPSLTCYGWHDETITEPNYLTKMQSLKTAAEVMFGELKKADPNMELIRVGADSYDDKTKTPQSIQWGTSYAETYVNKLPAIPDGGTDATGALTNALNALKKNNSTEANAHNGKGNTSFERFIVFMTDGEMTGNSSTWNSTIDAKVRGICDQAKADKDAAGNGIKIYTIAFMAPDRGKSLLNYCSSGPDYYYEPDNMTQLVQSFGEIARKAAKTGTRLTN